MPSKMPKKRMPPSSVPQAVERAAVERAALMPSSVSPSSLPPTSVPPLSVLLWREEVAVHCGAGVVCRCSSAASRLARQVSIRHLRSCCAAAITRSAIALSTCGETRKTTTWVQKKAPTLRFLHCFLDIYVSEVCMSLPTNPADHHNTCLKHNDLKTLD